MKFGFGMILILSLLLGSMAASAQAPANCVNKVTVWDNDTLAKIARENNVDVQELATLNGLPTTARLLIGQVLCLDGLATAQPTLPSIGAGGESNGGTGGSTSDTAPSTDQITAQEATATASATATATATPSATATASTTATATASATPAPASSSGAALLRGQQPPSTAYYLHRVVVGDNLYKIAQAAGVAMNSIASANNIPNPALIFLGEDLIIPGTPATATATPATGGSTAPVLTGFVPAQGSIPSLSLPARAKPGDTITVTGSNYPGIAPIQFYIERPALGLKSAVIAESITNAEGAFSFDLTIPTTWADGSAVTQSIISVSAYTKTGGYWAMNYFVNGD